jgi:5'-3' exonuclease
MGGGSGVNSAWPGGEKQESLQTAKNIKDYDGKRLAIDAAILKRRACASLEAGRQCFVTPPVPIDCVIQPVCEKAQALKNAGALPVVLLETTRPPLKEKGREKTDAERQDKINTYREEYARPEPEGEAEKAARIESLRVKRKEAAYWTEDTDIRIFERLIDLGIVCIMSFREFDHQAVSLYHQGLVDGAVTPDADLLFIGIPFIVTNINYTSGSCIEFERSSFLPGISGGVVVGGDSGESNYEASLLAALVGNDYHDGIPGVAVTRAAPLVKRILTQTTPARRAAVLADVCREAEAKSKTTGILKCVKESMAMFQHGMVFVVVDPPATYTDFLSVITDGTLRVRPGKLREASAPSPQRWQELTHMGRVHMRAPEAEASAYALMRESMTTKAPYAKLAPPKAADGAELPFGSTTDVGESDLWKEDPVTLSVILRARGIVVAPGDDAVGLVKQVCRLGSSAPQPRPSSHQVTCGRYSAFEPFESQQTTWERGSAAVAAIKAHVPEITDALLNKIYSEKKNRAKIKTIDRIRSGNLQIPTLEFAHVKLRDGNQTPVALFSIVCHPSQKDEPYRLHAAFLEGINEFIAFPISSCPCPVGRFFCTHVLAFLLLMRLVTTHDVEYEELAGLFEDTSTVKHEPIPVDFAYAREDGDEATLRGEALSLHRAMKADDEEELALATELDSDGDMVISLCSGIDQILDEARSRKQKRGGSGASAMEVDVSMVRSGVQAHVDAQRGEEFTNYRDDVHERIQGLADLGKIDDGTLICGFVRHDQSRRQSRLEARSADPFGGGPGERASGEPRPRRETYGPEAGGKRGKWCTLS